MNPPAVAAPQTPPVERCTETGLTKPECHCPACLAALVSQHRPVRP